MSRYDDLSTGDFLTDHIVIEKMHSLARDVGTGLRSGWRMQR